MAGRYDSSHVLYMQDEGGTEEWHIYAVDVTQGTTRDLTPLAGVTAYIHDLVLDHPGVAAIAINDRDKAWHDVYRIDIRTGRRELIVENTQELASIVLDRQLRPRLATKSRPEGGSSMFRFDGTALEQIRLIDHEDDLTTSVNGFTRDGKTLYIISSVGRDKAALLAMDWETGKEKVLAEHPKADISRILSNPETDVVEAASAEHLKVDWIPLNERIADDLKLLHGLLPGNVDIADRTPGRYALDRGLQCRRIAEHLPPVRPGQGNGVRIVLGASRTQILSPRAHAQPSHPCARRPRTGVVSHAA